MTAVSTEIPIQTPLQAEPQHLSSVWQASAVPAPALPIFSGSKTADVVVVGGGITGLNAVWSLAKRGVDCILLDAHDAGWGASGRNGGMAVLRYKKSWAALASALGDEKTLHLYRRIHEAVDTLEENVEELGIACSFSRRGHLTAATSLHAAKTLEADTAWLARVAGDRSPCLLNGPEMVDATGSAIYRGGYFDPRSAGLHPLDYCRNFAAALADRGVELYRSSPVTAIHVAKGEERVRVDTASGSVRARKVLMCTNAYTGDFGIDLHRRIIPITVAVIATKKLPADAAPAILPQDHLVTDTRNLVNYYRRAPNGGLLFGGRGSFSRRQDERFFDLLKTQLVETFPQLKGVDVEHSWTGQVALTLDQFPHIGTLDDKLFYAIGYGGRGVALSNLLGKHLANWALGERTDLGVMSNAEFRTVPFRGLHLPMKHVAAVYYRMRDRLGI